VQLARPWCNQWRVHPGPPGSEKITLVLKAIGDDKILVNSSSLDHPLVTLPDQGIEIVGIEKKVMVGG
jgi:hypothetical protein